MQTSVQTSGSYTGIDVCFPIYRAYILASPSAAWQVPSFPSLTPSWLWPTVPLDILDVPYTAVFFPTQSSGKHFLPPCLFPHSPPIPQTEPVCLTPLLVYQNHLLLKCSVATESLIHETFPRLRAPDPPVPGIFIFNSSQALKVNRKLNSSVPSPTSPKLRHFCSLCLGESYHRQFTANPACGSPF